MIIRWLAVAGALSVTALLTNPASAQAQAADASPGTRALLGSPTSSGSFGNLEVRPDDGTATPAERGLLGVASGVRVELTAEPALHRRSAGEAALLGR
ncbi:MAG TPA: hypothetical protein VFB89_05870 [Gemmatimonadales bacterium]|nr:hypothetical protein [Gemmatimonadales bacterium]